MWLLGGAEVSDSKIKIPRACSCAHLWSYNAFKRALCLTQFWALNLAWCCLIKEFLALSVQSGF